MRTLSQKAVIDDLAMLSAQPLKCHIDRDRSEDLLRVIGCSRLGRDASHNRPPGAGTRKVDEEVAQDAEEPTSKGASLRIEAIGAFPGSEQGLLHGVFGGAPSAHASSREGTEPRSVHKHRMPYAVVGSEIHVDVVACRFDHMPKIRESADRDPSVG